MFRELRATAPQTHYTFRTSNGTVDVLYVLLISLTALGLQALFFEARKNEASRKNSRLIHTRSKKFRQNRRRRAATALTAVRFAADVRQKKWMSRGDVFMNKKKIKIIVVLLMFPSFRAIQKNDVVG